MLRPWRLGPDPHRDALSEPYRRCIPYKGAVGTEGPALFLACCAAVSAGTQHAAADAGAASGTQLAAADAAIDLVARLIAAGMALGGYHPPIHHDSFGYFSHVYVPREYGHSHQTYHFIMVFLTR